MKFINKTTGVILETTSEFVINQLKKDDNYKEVEEHKVEKTEKKSKKEN